MAKLPQTVSYLSHTLLVKATQEVNGQPQMVLGLTSKSSALFKRAGLAVEPGKHLGGLNWTSPSLTLPNEAGLEVGQHVGFTFELLGKSGRSGVKLVSASQHIPPSTDRLNGVFAAQPTGQAIAMSENHLDGQGARVGGAAIAAVLGKARPGLK